MRRLSRSRHRALPSARSALFAAALLCADAELAGQIGDFPGEKQVPVIPAERIPPSPALSPEQALATFRLAPGIRLEIAAAEPLVQEPVAVAFAPDGAMWVVEMRGYMLDVDGRGEADPIGRVVVLRDTNADGRFDTSIVFVDGLVMPRAIMLVAGGALIGAPPELAYWQDTDGDGKADKKSVVAADYGVQGDPARPHLAGPERAPNSLLWGLDNWIYSSGYVRKFRWSNGRWDTAPMKFYGQWGLSQDDLGRLYYNYNSDHLRADLIPADYLRRNPHFPRLAGSNVKIASDQSVWPARISPGINRGYMPDMLREGRLKAFTAAGAPWVYRGDLLPSFYGDVFVTEPAGNLVRRAVMTSVDGGLEARNAYAQAEFVASTDERFRPVNFATGPDGALYVVDLYRGILQHRMSFTTYLRGQVKARGLETPVHLGRIYRVVPEGVTPPRARRFESTESSALAGYLSHRNAWFRETAQRLLVERRDPAIVPRLQETVRSAASDLGRLHALCALEGMEAIDRETVLHALHDRADAVVVAALRIAERFLDSPVRAELVRQMLTLARDGSPEVSRQALLSLGVAADPEIDVRAAEIMRRRAGLRHVRDALLSGLRDRELPLLKRILPGAAADAAFAVLAADLASGVLVSRHPARVQELMELLAEDSLASELRRALLAGMAAAAPGMAQRPLALPRQPSGWERWQADAGLRPLLPKLAAALLWPGHARASSAAAAPLTGEDHTRFAAGATLFAATCAPCHQTHGAGLAGLAPPLLDSEWVLGSAGRLVRIILHGVRGPIVVAGESFSGDMPGFGTLSDEMVASIATYIRREWGHLAAPISPAQVAAVRKETEGRNDAWTVREFTKLKIP